MDGMEHIGSMYGIYANIWGILMVNVTIYIHIWHTWILWGMTWRCLLMDLDRDTDSDVGPTKTQGMT
jgi:hypothetical protein